ncbi:PNLIPRP1 [Mytilus coruscus]|uniref:PNLIPRP1 n=1 Tax=Mytilus coruscus TaxID=42192 RepID=A0A6J8AXR3_MYTCO|nr:PNLIPRP1 [Mytilus coruscus]
MSPKLLQKPGFLKLEKPNNWHFDHQNRARISVLLAENSTSHVCYDHIGCFSNSPPFLNAFGYLPLSPEHINTSFHLYTQANPSKSQLLNPYGGAGSLRSTHFGLSHKTVFIIHGYHGLESNPWIPLMKDPLLKLDVNVIVVIWTRGAYDNYNQAVANTRVVGAVTANLVKLLHSSGGISYNDVHIVGHSLGAHVAGYVGQRVPIGRITGLDPAGPEFNTADQRVRLDPSDATFVDIIHTDGEIAPFYSCGHMRSIYYFIESINTNCHFTSHPCDSEDDFKNSLCTGCGIGCQEMGYHVSRNVRGTFYLKTSPNYPYCAGSH